MYGCFGKKLKKKEEEEEEENIGSKPGDNSNNNNKSSKNKSKRVSSLASNCGGEQSFSHSAAVVASAALDNHSSSTHSATFDDLSNHGGTGSSSSFSESTSSQPPQLQQLLQQQEKGLFESSSPSSSSFLVVGGEEEGGGGVVKEDEDKDEEKAFRIAALTAASSLSPVSARTTALRCYYCPAGFLVASTSPGEEVEEKDSKEQPSPFSCVDCGQRFPRGLPFILRLVGEQTADAAYWQAEHDRRRKEDGSNGNDGPRDVAHQAAALAMWRQALQQLRKLLPDASLRLLTAQLTLAEAAYCCGSEPSAEARQLLNGVLEQLLGGVLEPLEAVGEKRALLQAMTTALKMLRQMEGKKEEEEEEDGQQQQKLKGKIEQLEMLLLLEPQKEAAAAVE